MKKYMLLLAGLIFSILFTVAEAASPMHGATTVKMNISAANDVINGLVLNQGRYTIAPMYLFGEITRSTFPKSVAGKSSESFTLNIEPTGIWTIPIFYGDNQASQTGSNGCYFQFKLDKSDILWIAYASQGTAICSYSGNILAVDL